MSLLEISVAIIAVTFVTFTVFFISLLISMKKAVGKVQSDFHALSAETAQLMDKVLELTLDVKKKSHSLDFIFNALNSCNQEPENKRSIIPHLIKWGIASVIVTKKAKEFIHGKS